ncbi:MULTISPECIES: LysR substrate-binding domain-containing protein [Rhizobium]|uniref:LysR substrate-binding domain-containing protein n=1 Tax=Rhizobium phaseoli TaxID=396 RepID=UPI000A1BFF71|nr:periplasmic binding fold domain-containing protein [Rhizobium phaseoli Brasil 5]
MANSNPSKSFRAVLIVPAPLTEPSAARSIGDVEQRFLFTDTLAVVAGSNHPLTGQSALSIKQLAAYPWIVDQRGTPIGLTLRLNWMPSRAQEQFLRFASSDDDSAAEMS